MRHSRERWLLGVLVLACAIPREATAAPNEPLQIVPSHARLRPGETMQLRAVPPGEGSWSSVGPGGVSRDGLYLAPYIVPPPGTRVVVSVRRGPKDAPITAETVIELSAGAYPGAQDCLAPGQAWSPGGRAPFYTAVDELPEAMTKVQAEYSKSMRARGLAGGLIVNALVCRSGRVLDATASWGIGVTPVPELESAAIEATKQWIFKPGSVAGQPVATVVAIPFSFPPH